MTVKTRKMTLGDFFDLEYLPSAQARKRSWKTERSVFNNNIRKYFGHKPLVKISYGEVCEWFEKTLRPKYRASTCNRMLAVLRAVFRLALERGLLPGRSPCAGVRNFKVEEGRERFLNQAEAQKLYAALKTSPAQEAAALKLLILTGARKSEILRARWRDIDFERGVLTVPVSKSGRPRHIVLSKAALGLLRRLARQAVCEWLFPSKNGQKPASDIFYFWKKLRSSLNLKDVRIHDLRHTFASILVCLGQSLFICQKLLGHRHPETTMRYAHLDTAPLRKAVETVSSYLKSGGSGEDISAGIN